MLNQVGGEFGFLNFLILNASGGLEKDRGEDYSMLLNCRAQLNLLKKSMPWLRSSGRVVFVTRILERQSVLQTSQVLFRRICVSLAMVLPFKDSEGGTWILFDFNWSYLCRHAPVKKQTQYANRAKDLPLIKISVPPLARPLNPAAPRSARSNCRIPLAGLRRGLASHLAHFYGKKPVHPGYEPVAAGKLAGEKALRAMIPGLAVEGIALIVVSGDMIEGTITPRLLNRTNRGLIDFRRKQAGRLPTVEEFGLAIAQAAADPYLQSGATVYVGATD
jgi:hypothetical protein